MAAIVETRGMVSASEVAQGAVRLATTAEAQALASALIAMTPARVNDLLASIATLRTGTAADRIVTVDGLASLWQQGSDIASAATLVKPSDANLGGYHVITGTTGISAGWSGEPAGTEYEFRFAGACLLTHGASWIMPTGANVTTAAGDVVRFRIEATNVWRVVSAPPSWYPVVAAAHSINVLAKTAGYTATTADKGKEINFTTAGFTLTLPAASGNDGLWYVVRNSASTGDVTIDPNASETLDGLTTRLLRPGDVVIIRCDGTAWQTISGAYSFESAEQTMALSTVNTVAHGLGVKPNFLRVVYRCKTAESGWSVGDEIEAGATQSTYGRAFGADATNCVHTNQQTYAWYLGNKTTGAGTVLTYANWKLVFYAKDLRG